jgi:hypothetical protein
MIIVRKNQRYPSVAQASIAGAFSGEVLLKDLSVTGCRLESTILIDIQPSKHYVIRVTPEPAAKIAEFDISVEARWVKAGSCGCEMGFLILESPKGKFFQRYVDYLVYHSA